MKYYLTLIDSPEYFPKLVLRIFKFSTNNVEPLKCTTSLLYNLSLIKLWTRKEF